MTAASDELEVFLDAERDIDAPAPAARERLLARLEPLLLVPVALAATSAVMSASATTAADTAGSAVLSSALKAKIAAGIVSAALVGGALGVTGHAYLASPPAPVSVAVTPVAPLRAPEPPPPAEPAPVAVPAAPGVAPAVGGTRPERPRATGSLRAERLLIETASAALMRGDPKAALAALRQHAQKFPQGELAEEREVLLAKVRAATGGGAVPEK